MPWCTACDRFLSPATVTPAGECPRCGSAVDPGRAHAPGADDDPERPQARQRRSRRRQDAVAAAPDDDDETLPVPWHLKVLVGAVALYLGYRAYEGVAWVVGRL